MGNESQQSSSSSTSAPNLANIPGLSPMEDYFLSDFLGPSLTGLSSLEQGLTPDQTQSSQYWQSVLANPGGNAYAKDTLLPSVKQNMVLQGSGTSGAANEAVANALAGEQQTAAQQLNTIGTEQNFPATAALGLIPSLIGTNSSGTSTTSAPKF